MMRAGGRASIRLAWGRRRGLKGEGLGRFDGEELRRRGGRDQSRRRRLRIQSLGFGCEDWKRWLEEVVGEDRSPSRRD